MACSTLLHRVTRTGCYVALVLLCGVVIGCGEAPDNTTASKGTAATQPTDAAPAKTTTTSDPACAAAVIPTIETIESGKYAPLSRPLYMYVNKASLKRPEVATFMKFVLNEGQDLVSLVQYIRLDKTTLEESRKLLNEATADAKIEGEIKGKLRIDGSSTVFPIAQAAAERFIESYPEVEPQVGKSGTGGGFKKFVLGETDISDASRPISATEIEQCQKNKVEYLELKVAIDGLAVVVNPENSFCECLTIEQLKKLWEPDSKVKLWSELDPKWPAEEIKLYGPDTDSGTFDYFTEVICGKAKASRADYISSTEDNVLVKGVEGDKFAIGYFGFAYYAENSKNLKIVAIHPPSGSSAAPEKK